MTTTHRDQISGNRRTWPYGTVIGVRVVKIIPSTRATIVADEDRQGYVLFGDKGDGAAEGDSGTITFMKGGPTGGYFQFKKL